MNKEKFLLDLEKRLKKLPNEEKEAAITYYKEYFAEAGETNEETVIKEIGTPAQIASQIMANFIVKETSQGKEDQNIKSSLSIVWIVILAIFASPVALPIAIVIITLILVTWIVIITFWLSGVCVFLAGIVYLVVGVLTLTQDISLAIFILGSGLLGLGLGAAITIGSTNLFIKYSSWITTTISKHIIKRGKKNEK